MRIVVVSAHYPPNFVSGGTLQPQRIARSLRQRGHDVRVFAGWLGDLPPLEEWDEVDETGLPVRWIVTTPWTAWHLRRNWDNQEVTRRFASFLAEARPDVVHLHSLQSFGGRLVEVAAETGAKVAVTMHDFWWVCSRQFLVNKALEPCSLVVAAGTCPCEVDRTWLDDRNQALRSMLSAVDLVLAPSGSAAAVLAANGLEGGRLVVNENGLEPSAPADGGARDDHRRTGSVRLLYTGGPNPLKGVGVLLEAARLLADRLGWTLVAYGAASYVEETGIDLAGLPVEVRPPFDPATAAGVYREADVFVLPSVMRESYSLATREALASGLPVVCTDTLGPEEVVEDGRNGLVVPAADPAALAGAIGRILDEPDLLRHLAKGCLELPPVPTLDEQVDALEVELTRLVAGPPPAVAAARRTVGRVLFVCGIEGAPLRYRAALPAEAMDLLDVHCDVRQYRDRDVPALAQSADAVVVYRVPATIQVLDLIGGIRARGVPVLFDVDDLIFDPDLAAEIPALKILAPDEAALWLQGVRRYRMTMEACDGFVGSTAALCHHATAVTGLRAERLPNGVGLGIGRLSDTALRRARTPGPLRFGYFSGTNTHDHDWRFVEGAVAQVLERHPGAELWLVGHVPAAPDVDRFGDRIVRRPLLPYEQLPALLRDLDVNLAPLAPDSRFNDAKSAIKWLEAALVATPTLASPTEPFCEAIVHGRTGWLAGDPDAWVDGLDRLLADPDLRLALGRRARRDALLRFSPHVQGRTYLRILETAPLRDGTPPAPAWPQDVLDEPPMPAPTRPLRRDPMSLVGAAVRRLRASASRRSQS